MDRNRRRKFGQNFLNNPGIAAEIIGDLPLGREDTVLEIGPGHGAITRVLLPRTAHLTAVEIDPECAKYLLHKHGGDRRFELIREDFLKMDLESWLETHPQPWVVGNLPYNVATPIMSRLFPYLRQVKGMLFMVQLEVAKRLCAEPGNRAYGSFTVWLQSWGQAKILRHVGPEHFRPRPKVMSAMVLIEAREDARGLTYEENLFVQQCFAQKRKKMINSLEKIWPKTAVRKAMESLGIPENTRAEELHPGQFVTIYRHLQDHQKPAADATAATHSKDSSVVEHSGDTKSGQAQQ